MRTFLLWLFIFLTLVFTIQYIITHVPEKVNYGKQAEPTPISSYELENTIQKIKEVK